MEFSSPVAQELAGTAAVNSSSVLVMSVWATRFGYSWSVIKTPAKLSALT